VAVNDNFLRNFKTNEQELFPASTSHHHSSDQEDEDEESSDVKALEY
jgi:hypothetical protein